MKVNLISFQNKAVKQLRVELADASDAYRRRKKTQVISLQAPTGAGKTIIAAALIEGVYYGMTLADGTTYDEQPEAIFVWLSDSPELNEQSRQKIEFKSTDRLRFGQCVTISEESFDMEMLEDGHIYFLNTQKLSKNGKLTQHSDERQYTIWETLDNTVQNKSDRLYFIIDEAHRGAKSKTAQGADTTIMQRFIKGYEYINDYGINHKMRAMPVVLGISATSKRFDNLIGNTANVSLNKYVVTSEEVRDSGLLKDRIAVIYPQDAERKSDVALLKAAVTEWLKKWARWQLFTKEQNCENVDPVLVIQVRQGSGEALTDTNLADVLAIIEETAQFRFKEGEVVHCFGEGITIEVNGLRIPHIKASDIVDNHDIKIVLFKEALSTGWDCPRAEAMMSFAVRNDPTYIAQLLGRMVRTPLQMHIDRDESLNDVKLYLPHFDKDTVKKVVDELQANEGSDIPTDINSESIENPTFVVWTAHTQGIENAGGPENKQSVVSLQMSGSEAGKPQANSECKDADESANKQHNTEPAAQGNTYLTEPCENSQKYNLEETGYLHSGDIASISDIPAEVSSYKQLALLDRVEIIDAINKKGFLNYCIRRERVNDYLKSLLDLANLLTHNRIHLGARNEVINDVTEQIRSYVNELRDSGRYDEMENRIRQIKLSVQAFDPFGQEVKAHDGNVFALMSGSDLDRMVRISDAKLGRYGFPSYYGKKYFDENNPDAYKIDCLLFAEDETCIAKLNEYAKEKLREFSGKYRVIVANQSSEECKHQYHRIMMDSTEVSEQNFAIPERITLKMERDGKEYSNHLLAEESTGVARIKLNGWETALIKEESQQSDFVCWLRNPSKASWALCLPYVVNGETRAFYPDFLIVRNNSNQGYVFDILEPHGSQYADTLPKAKALAIYAQKEARFGRIQIIRKTNDAGDGKLIRLDLTDFSVRDRIIHANNDDELNNIFANYSITIDSIAQEVNEKKKTVSRKQTAVSEDIINSFSIRELPFLGCDYDSVYPEIEKVLPADHISYCDLALCQTITCEIICAAICHQMNWDYLREAVYDKTLLSNEWLKPSYLATIAVEEVEQLFSGYHKKERIRKEERTAILHEVGTWLLSFPNVESIFLSQNGELLEYQIILHNLGLCKPFAIDPEGKKLQLLLQKLSVYSQFSGLKQHYKPAIDYHLIRTYVRRGLLFARTRHAVNYLWNEEVKRKDNTVAAIRQLCSEIMINTCRFTSLDISTVNQIEWHIGRSVCVQDNPDCCLEQESAKWLKPAFSKCPFYETCLARKNNNIYLLKNEPTYIGTSY